MNRDLLRRLSNAPGLSGFEDEVQELVRSQLDLTCDETRLDRLGNVIGLKRGIGAAEAPVRVVLAAHVDEIGMMVKYIEPTGFIRFAPVGGVQAAASTSQRVVIHGREQVQGVVIPGNRTDDKALTLDDLVIDLGLPVDEVRKVVEVGDPITYAQEFVELSADVVMGRNFDDRIGTFCMLEAIDRVGETRVDVYAVSTVQEEVGVRGMPVAAFAIEPDIGIALDGSLCRSGEMDRQARDVTCEFGQGTGIYVMDRLTIGAPRLVAFLVELCKSHEIPFQRNVGGGTDASAIQRTRTGALATTVGAPVRYMHSTVQLCHVGDIEATIELIVAFLEHAHELPLDA